MHYSAVHWRMSADDKSRFSLVSTLIRCRLQFGCRYPSALGLSSHCDPCTMVVMRLTSACRSRSPAKRTTCIYHVHQSAMESLLQSTVAITRRKSSWVDNVWLLSYQYQMSIRRVHWQHSVRCSKTINADPVGQPNHELSFNAPHDS